MEKTLSMVFLQTIRKFNPAIPARWLMLTAGGMWSAVGLLLGSYAVRWWMASTPWFILILVFVGVILAITAYFTQFRKLARKNIARIKGFNNKVCIFAFQAVKGYLIIVVMMAGGVLLKHSSIPKEYLAIVYCAIGGALFLSSTEYYVHFLRD